MGCFRGTTKGTGKTLQSGSEGDHLWGNRDGKEKINLFICQSRKDGGIEKWGIAPNTVVKKESIMKFFRRQAIGA